MPPGHASQLPRKAARAGARAFTLIEMLTAVAVLGLVVALLGQSVGTMSRTWLAGQRRANNFTKARVMLDMFAQDVQAGLFRPDLAAFPAAGTGSDPAFYTRRQGVAAGQVPRAVSLVKYRFDPAPLPTNVSLTTLERGDLAVLWNSAATLVSFGDAAALPAESQLSYRNTAPGVIAFQIAFVRADGTLAAAYAPGGTNPPRAAGMTLAVVDDQTLLQLSAAQIGTLRAGLAQAADGTRNVQDDWQRYLSGLDWSRYPRALGDGLKIFARYVPFPDS